jgi:hypothetical protein
LKKKIEDHLKVLRDYFYKVNGVLREKINRWRDEGCFSSYAGSNEHYYKDFLIMLQDKGFQSENLCNIFEYLMHIHFFTFEHDLSLEVSDYIKHDDFRRGEFLKDMEEHVEVTVALNVIRTNLCSLLKKLNITSLDFLNSRRGEELLEILKLMRHAKDKSIETVGSSEFLISKIPITGKGFIVGDDLTLNDNIFYTHKPEQIIAMAHAANPGIYIIANIPYGEEVNTAFYHLFVTNGGDAYIVENSVHNLREQIYRNKTDGTNGKDAWLDKRYEYSWFPVDQVLTFIDKKSNKKDVILPSKEGHTFHAIGKISASGPETILFCLSFADCCMKLFNDSDITLKADHAACLSFVQDNLDTVENLPAVYTKGLPTFAEMEKPYSDDLTGNSVAPSTVDLVPRLKEMSLAEINKDNIHPGQLMPLEQLRNKLVFMRRNQQAKELEEELMTEYEETHLQVRDSIKALIDSKPFDRYLLKALKDEKYSVTEYPSFGSYNKIKDKNGQEEQTTLLYVADTRGPRESFYSNSRAFGHPANTFEGRADKRENISVGWHKDPRLLYYKEKPMGYHDTVYCDCCGTTRMRYKLTLFFLEYFQFKRFFELTEEEDKSMPEPLRTHLNQSRTLYKGNSILNDIDPVSHIRNPWWASNNMDLDRHPVREQRISDTSVPALFVQFHLCGRCLKKKKKEAGATWN